MHSLLPVCQNRKFKIDQGPKNKHVGGQSVNLNNTVFPSLQMSLKQNAAVNMLSTETSLQSLVKSLSERALSERISFISRIP